MALIRHNSVLELRPFGFNNLGATCYFNAVLQSLLSCTSFIHYLLKNKKNPEYNENPVTRKLIELVDMALNMRGGDMSSNSISQMSSTIWNEMIKFLCKKNNMKSNNFMNGQQCAGDGFHCLIDSLENFEDIQDIFRHRYKTMVYCIDCDKCVSDVNSTNFVFKVPPNLQNEQLDRFKKYDKSIDEKYENKQEHTQENTKDAKKGSITNKSEMNKFLARQYGYVDKFFKCPKCTRLGEKYRIDHLVMSPEILVVLSKKYVAYNKLDVYTEFPKTMEFNGKNNIILKYEAVSQIEHIGNLNSGHYWAISRRHDGWYSLNDNQFTKYEFNPTKNTYIVFYHLM